jgi:hypothetical protein
MLCKLRFIPSFFSAAALAEKRKAEEEAAEQENVKRQKLEVHGDIPKETVTQILDTLSDPNESTGVDVSTVISAL